MSALPPSLAAILPPGLAFDGLPAWAMAVSIALHLAAGYALGGVYFRAVWWNVRQFVHGRRLAVVLALALGRLALLGGVLAAAALEGAAPLLAMAGGILIARVVVMRRLRGRTP